MAQKKFLDYIGLQNVIQRLSSIFAKSADFSAHSENTTVHMSTAEKTNLTAAYNHSQTAHAPSTAEKNTIVGIQKNGVDLTPNSTTRKVNITLTKSDVGLTNVENKSGAAIRAELTKDEIVDALGYTPPTTDTKYTHPTYTAKASGLYKVTVDGTGHVSAATAVSKADITALGIPSSDTNTHYTSKNVVGASTATSNTTTALTNGNVYINSVENGVVTSAHKISGSGAATVTTDASGNIIISSTNTNTTYSAGTGLSLSGTTFNHSNSVTAGTAQGNANKTLTFGGTFTIPTVTYDAQGHITGKGTTTMTMPANPNTDTHHTAKNVVGATTATSNTTTALTNGNVYLNLVENGAVRSTHKISGSGATTVTTDTSGNIVVSSTDTNTVYTHPTTSGNKHIPSGGSSGQILRWSADGTAVWGADNNTTYSTFKGATADTAGGTGLVPAPASGSQTKYLKADGTWATPPNTTYSNFVKSGTGAKAGLVPAPSTTAGTTKYLREDGTWTIPPNTTYSSLKNPYALTIQGNGTTLNTYDGSSAISVNITPAAIGAATSSHTHSYLLLSGGTLTGDVILPITKSSVDASLPVAGSTLSITDDITDLSNYKTYLGSYTHNKTWYNIISTRHRNGSGDGTSYGMYFRSTLTSIGDLTWGKQYGASSWQSERTILDSSNYTSYAPTKTGSGASGNWGINITGSSASCTGNSATATALTTSAGSATQPVYFSGGKPVACTYTLGKSVPSTAVFTDTTYSNMTAATSSAAGKAGLVPAPGAGKQTSFLRGDGTWVVPTNTTYSNMTAATASAAGKAGLVPAPAAGKQASFLRGDGTWVVPTNTTYSAATTSAAGLMSAADKTKLDGIATGANKYTLPTASSSTLGGVKTTSTVTSTSGYTACPIVSGVPYYKDTNTTYTLSSFGVTATSAELNCTSGATSNLQTQINTLNSTLVYKETGESTGNYYINNNAIFTKKAGIIQVRLTATTNVNIEPDVTHTIAYIPSGFNPSINIPVPCMFNGSCKGIIFLTTDGDIQVVVNENISKNSYIRFNTCYIL